MKRNKSEVRSIGLTLIIMAFVLVAMFVIVYGVRTICGEGITNGADNKIVQTLSEEEQYVKGFVLSQKIIAVELIIENMSGCGELTDNQYKRYSEVVETLLDEASETGKISKRTRKQFNEMLDYFFEKEDYSGNFKKEELILTEDIIDADAMATGLVWIGYRSAIYAFYSLGKIDSEVYELYTVKEEEYFRKFTSEWREEIAIEFFEYSSELLDTVGLGEDNPDIYVPDSFAKGGAHKMGASAHFIMLF